MCDSCRGTHLLRRRPHKSTANSVLHNGQLYRDKTVHSPDIFGNTQNQGLFGLLDTPHYQGKKISDSSQQGRGSSFEVVYKCTRLNETSIGINIGGLNRMSSSVRG